MKTFIGAGNAVLRGYMTERVATSLFVAMLAIASVSCNTARTNVTSNCADAVCGSCILGDGGSKPRLVLGEAAGWAAGIVNRLSLAVQMHSVAARPLGRLISEASVLSADLAAATQVQAAVEVVCGDQNRTMLRNLMGQRLEAARRATSRLASQAERELGHTQDSAARDEIRMVHNVARQIAESLDGLD